jgi:hypothetical protein
MRLFWLLLGMIVGAVAVLLAPVSMREYGSLRLRLALGEGKDRVATEIYRMARESERRLEEEGYSRAGERERNYGRQEASVPTKEPADSIDNNAADGIESGQPDEPVQDEGNTAKEGEGNDTIPGGE